MKSGSEDKLKNIQGFPAGGNEPISGQWTPRDPLTLPYIIY